MLPLLEAQLREQEWNVIMAESTTRALPNPVAFRPTQVTAIVTVVYVVLFTVLLWIHNFVPAAATAKVPLPGINQTEAWRDLQELSYDYRPVNSHRNDQVRKWLIDRAEALVLNNAREVAIVSGFNDAAQAASSDVIIWEDLQSNLTFLDSWRARPWSCYIESQNVMIYVRGTEDEEGAWWEKSTKHKRGILVNAHYDSVSTGYGATDDGCGVITVLQLISHFTTAGNTPRNGIMFLLNNGEEDGLYGAHAFSQHPWSSFPGSFLNLEGAGAGGRATLFRSTDAEITSFYAGSPHPFGTVVSADGFKRGLVRSGTDYSVFTEDLDIRGLDVAFMEPRSRYHTDQDDARDTSKDSLWHMLSAALATTKALDQHSRNFESLSATQSDAGVWFDLFGAAFAVFTLYLFSALSIALLIVGPLSIGLTIMYLVRINKWYPFLPRQATDDASDPRSQIYRLRGFFRLPIALVISILVLAALQYLLESQNPYIVYRSPLAVWSLFLTAFFLISWSIVRLADHTRPTVLSRWYAALWIYIFSWVALVVATNLAIAASMGSGYFVLIYNLSAFVTLTIGTFEFLALPRRRGGELSDDSVEGSSAREGDADEADERTALLRNEDRQTFTGRARQPAAEEPPRKIRHFLSRSPSDDWLNLPSWTWLLQFVILAPINIILVGQIGLFLTSALHQTPADGNDTSTIYSAIIGCSILLILPILPFAHKIRPSLSFLLLLVLIGSVIWTALAFPFSRDARLKCFFLQEVDLASGNNTISLTGISPYLERIIAEMPSAAGQDLDCRSPGEGQRNGLSTCTWHGLAPKISTEIIEDSYATWLKYNVTTINATSASFSLRGHQTKNCRITFDTPVHGLLVDGGATDYRHPSVAENGSTQARLFSREWDKHFQINVTWSTEAMGQTGRIGCMWAELDNVPAIMELQKYSPVWSAVTKHDDGLVEGWYDWEIKST